MKPVVITALASVFAVSLFAQEQKKITDTTLLQPVELNAVRAFDKTPVAKTNISKKEIRDNNTGQDLPFILGQAPSVIVNSDAGNGIGYTGIRIRGTDASRINVTINGVPYNDAESQGTYFVDLPDIASSTESIQIQRGVGTSANGAGAFGGTINLNSNEIITKRSLEFNNSAGSYHSFKNTLLLNSGLIGKHFTIDGRLSNISSNGYIERAFTRLRSFYSSAAYIDNRNSLRLNIFSGKEKTYQAWNGIDEKTLSINRRYNAAGTEKPGEPYDNETDNYLQTHYQLFYNRKISKNTRFNIISFLTRGKGYYEQYKAAAALSDYGLPDYNSNGTIISETDLVRRLWLDNYFYGALFSVQYQQKKTSLIAGGGWNSYDGKHYGIVKWAAIQAAVPKDHRWYDLTAYKRDYSGYAKWTQELVSNWQTFVDVQLRYIDYKIHGFRNNPTLEVSNHYLFLNPKAGITYTKNKWQAYFSYAHAGKEPNRDDFEAGATSSPKPEKLHDFELGIEHKSKKAFWGINFYYMLYRNQLVLTGKINDVGAYTRTNIPRSYRAGVELQGRYTFSKLLSVNANFTLSENKIKNFTEYIDDYDNGGQQAKFYNKTDISFSPAVVSAAAVNITPIKGAELKLLGKYVSRQYLDNTSQRSRSLHDYYVQDLRLAYSFKVPHTSIFQAYVQVNNLFSKKYEPNGYTFSYYYGGDLTTENYYFPMATINFMAGLNIKL
ncbi:MAG: TonB-dependent receptor plug domain-containing protein [Ferruginibacter sp.]